MMADFYDAFGKNASMDRDIPAEILELLNKDLPDNFMYVKDTNGKYMAVPRPDCFDTELRLTTEPDLDETLAERIKLLPSNKQLEYFYRTQRIIPIKNIKIGDKNKVVPIEKTMTNPLRDEKFEIQDSRMYPQKFPEPVELLFESAEGSTVPIAIQQQPYDSMVEIKFSNVSFPALHMEIYQFAPLDDNLNQEHSFTSADAPVRLTYSVTPSKAHTVKDAISALHIFRGLLNGTAKINGQLIEVTNKESTADFKQIEEALLFWTTASKLEERLKVAFVPCADFPAEDAQFFKELSLCLIEGKRITWKHPFDHFHLGEYQFVEKDHRFEDLIGRTGICYQFIEGPIIVTLLGVEFNIYSRTELKDFIITNIEWDDSKQEGGGEVYIADAPGTVLKLSRLYITEADYRNVTVLSGMGSSC